MYLPTFEQTVDQLVTEIMQEQPPCTHRSHDKEARAHGGPAVAIGHYHCPDCGRDKVNLLCAPYVEACRQGRLAVCMCGAMHRAGTCVTIVMLPVMVS